MLPVKSNDDISISKSGEADRTTDPDVNDEETQQQQAITLFLSEHLENVLKLFESLPKRLLNAQMKTQLGNDLKTLQEVDAQLVAASTISKNFDFDDEKTLEQNQEALKQRLDAELKTGVKGSYHRKLKALIDALADLSDIECEDDCTQVMPKVDPICRKPIETPVKSGACNHIYDKATILSYLSTKKELTCPYFGCKTALDEEDLVDFPEYFDLLKKQENKCTSKRGKSKKSIETIDC